MPYLYSEVPNLRFTKFPYIPIKIRYFYPNNYVER
jgi:hypothetical protein